jgi:hypothetical protein
LEKAIEDARRWKDSNVHGLAELILYKWFYYWKWSTDQNRSKTLM